MPALDRSMLDLAARLAWRGAGYVEPNPMVGAVLVRQGLVIGLGHHRRFGGPHAEREALADARRRGADPRGGTLYVTLEPCRHHGKTPPCTDAIIDAGVSLVVAARRDPNPVSRGGAEVLRGSGVAAEFTEASARAVAVSDPFVKRVTTGLPWVIAKWAQFADGRMVTRPGEPRWITGELARRRVHRLRGRVDAVLTGIGTVLADDPMLTVRGLRPRRRPARVVLDAGLRLPLDSALARTAREVRTLVACGAAGAGSSRGRALAGLGLGVVPVAEGPGGLDLPAVLGALVAGVDATNVLVEAGPTLLWSFFEAGLVDEAVVHIASGSQPGEPFEPAPDPARDARYRALRRKRLGPDLEILYGRARGAGLTDGPVPASAAPRPG